MKSDKIYLYPVIILGLMVRLFLSVIPGFKIDMDAWFAWATRLNEVIPLSSFTSTRN